MKVWELELVASGSLTHVELPQLIFAVSHFYGWKYASPQGMFALEIRHWLSIVDTEPPCNFDANHTADPSTETTSMNIQPHEISFRRLTNCSETPPGSLACMKWMMISYKGSCNYIQHWIVNAIFLLKKFDCSVNVLRQLPKFPLDIVISIVIKHKQRCLKYRFVLGGTSFYQTVLTEAGIQYIYI